MRADRLFSIDFVITVVFVGFFILFSPVAAQEGDGDPDAWEAYWNKHQPADKVLDAIGIKAGMNVGEVGAERGRYAVLVAKRVGPAGEIYANDINSKALDYLNFRCRRDRISNIETILGTETDPKFPVGKLDFVYFINTYHHIKWPVELLKNVIPGLKPGGRLAIIEHVPGKASGIHGTFKGMVLQQAKEAGFKLERIETFLKYDNIYIFRVE
jgi:ubiquinone/menaquinone biosynthesis C-methylase UbiE